jgi:hypothetical protein
MPMCVLQINESTVKSKGCLSYSSLSVFGSLCTLFEEKHMVFVSTLSKKFIVDGFESQMTREEAERER